MTSAAPVTVPPAAESVTWILGLHSLPGHVAADSIALRWQHGERTYAALRDRALSLAAAFIERGFQPGDRIAAHLLNRGETFELYFACAYAGLTLVPVSFRLTAREIGFVLEDSTPKMLFTQKELLPPAHEAIAALPDQQPELVILGDGEAGPGYDALATTSPHPVPDRATEIQLLLYTSGTTGRPKGVELRHRNILWFALQQAASYRMDTRTVTMLTGPMYNTAALNEQSIPTLFAGGTVTIMPSRGWRPHAMAELMDQWAVTHALIYPSMMEPLLAADRERPIPLSSMKFSLTGGENCPPAVMKRFRDRWPHIELCIAYGSTESGIVSLIAGDEIERHPGSVGRPAGGQVFTIVDKNGAPTPDGQIGHIWTAGPTIVSGYWRAPELTSQVLHNGWLDMGDLGRIDKDGYLFIEGRSKDMIISKGQNIYPAEIENTIIEHSAVLEVAVVGVPDSEAGEAVAAIVVVKPGRTATEAELISFVQQRIASYKKPKYVWFVDRLPRSPSGKVLKAELSTIHTPHSLLENS